MNTYDYPWNKTITNYSLIQKIVFTTRKQLKIGEILADIGDFF